MSVGRRLFRPGVGSTHAKYTTAYMNGTTAYTGDLVCWDITAPASQGATAGTIDGKSAGATDFVYVILPPAAEIAALGLQAGIAQSTNSGLGRSPSNGTANAISDDALVVIQTAGVCADVFAVSNTDAVAGSILTTTATTGAVTQVGSTDVAATNSTYIETMVGFVLTTQATDHNRGATATEPGIDAWIRCDY